MSASAPPLEMPRAVNTPKQLDERGRALEQSRRCSRRLSAVLRRGEVRSHHPEGGGDQRSLAFTIRPPIGGSSGRPAR